MAIYLSLKLNNFFSLTYCSWVIIEILSNFLSSLKYLIIFSKTKKEFGAEIRLWGWNHRWRVLFFSIESLIRLFHLLNVINPGTKFLRPNFELKKKPLGIEINSELFLLSSFSRRWKTLNSANKFLNQERLSLDTRLLENFYRSKGFFWVNCHFFIKHWFLLRTYMDYQSSSP